jgi:short-subunit dehydrogenase
MRHFEERGRGHLVSISSIAALRGWGGAPAYGASKAFMSTYMDALRHRAARRGLPIATTDVQPGFVDTAMSRESERRFWVATPDEVARQILEAVRRRRKRVVVTRRWVLVAWAYRLLPGWVFDRLG